MYLQQLPSTVPAGIAYRVECVDPMNRLCYQTLVDEGRGGMKPCGEHLVGGSFRQTAFAHVIGARIPTPLMSLWSTWERAMQHRDWMLRIMGAGEVVVVVVWLDGRSRVYDAQRVVRWLGFSDNAEDEKRRVETYRDVLLVHGAIPADEHRILACIRGTGPDMPRLVANSPCHILALPRFRAEIPSGVWLRVPDPDAGLAWVRARLEWANRSDAEVDAQLVVLGVSLRAPGLQRTA